MKITMIPEKKFNIDFIKEIVGELHQQYKKYPAGKKIRYEIYLGEDDSEDENRVNDYYSRLEALNQLKEEGIILEYAIESKTEEIPLGEFAASVIEYKIAKCLIDKNELQKHINDLSDFEKNLKESKGNYSENKNATPEPKISQSIIKPKSLELIAREIGELDTYTNLIKFLTECGIEPKLIQYIQDEYPKQSKWQLIYTVLSKLATSPNPKYQEILFKIIEEAAHPLMHNGNEELAKTYEDKFNKLLKYDGFTLGNYKIKKINKEDKEDNDLNLYLKKKILLGSWRDDLSYPITELSFNNNTVNQICYSLWHLFVPDIIFFGVNTFPEDILIETDPRFHKEIAFNWNLIRDLDNNPHKLLADYGFDIEILNEKKLKKDINEEIKEFIYNKTNYKAIKEIKDFCPNTKFYETPSYLQGISCNYYAYQKQKEILLNFIAKAYNQFENELLVIKFNNIQDPNINTLRTMLALENEGFFDIKELSNDKKEWIDKDDVYTKIQLIKSKIPIIKKIASATDKQNQEIKEQEKPKELPATRIEIIGMPPLVFKESEEKKSLHKISLKSVQISYDDDEPIIKIGKRNVGLPPYKNEHYFCQAVFEHKPKEPISWDIIYDKMTGYSTVSGGKKPEPIRENWQKVNDTMKRLNNRIKEVVNTDDDLFSWSEKMVIRNY